MHATERAIPFILITVMLDSMGLGLVIPVMPHLLASLAPGGMENAAAYGGALALVFALAQFVCAPILGNLSDAVGRRPVLLISLACYGLDYLAMAFAPTFGWLVVTRVISGVTGATFAVASAYVADLAPPDERAKRIGMIGAAFGIGFIVGPALGGLLGGLGTRAPFVGAAILSLANVAYGAFVLPESLRRERRRPFDRSRANPLGTLRSIARYPGVLAIACAQFAWFVAFQSLPSTFAFYTTQKFVWSPPAVGASLAFSGVMIALVQGGLVGTLVRRLGEPRAAVIGLVAGAVGFGGYAFASTSWMIYAAAIPWALSGLVGPSLSALMSRAAPPDAQGELQGGIASVMGLAAIVGPVLMTQLFTWYTRAGHPYFPGASFAAAAALALLAAAIFTTTQAARRKRDAAFASI